MEVEKRSSKGGFLQLFDWNLKSRKKLFSSKSELSVAEDIKQGKENVDGLAISRHQQVNENGRGTGSRSNDDLHYHSASSINGEEGYGTKAPGVVARLMGLDRLPTSNVSEPYNSYSFESQSFRDFYSSKAAMDFQNEHHIVIYESMRNKLDGMTQNPLVLRLEKVQSRPIERFQREVLPPKSAKPIAVTHNRLLSPIKSPGFIPPKNAAYIIEAAAKIIEQSPRSTVKGKLPSFGSSSAPLRLQDLKEKMEAAKKSSRVPEVSNKQSSTKIIRRQPSDNGMHLVKASEPSKVGLQNLKNKEKVSLAVQAKTNIQKRDGSTSVGKLSVNQKERSETKSTCISKNQPNLRKTAEKRISSARSTDVLKQNNQKQNCISSKDRESLKPSTSGQKDRKYQSTSDIPKASKVINKIIVNASVGSGKTNTVEIDSRKDSSDSRIKKFSGKKRPVSTDVHSEKSANSDVLMSKEVNTVKCNIAIGGESNWDAVDRKNGTDVVSFTFTSPIKRSLPGSHSSQAITKNKNLRVINDDDGSSSKYSTASLSGFNVVGSDALSVLLEQKLKELTSKVEFSNQDQVRVQSLCSSANNLQESVATLSSMNSESIYTKGHFDLSHDNPGVKCYSDCSYDDELKFKAMDNWQESEEKVEHTSSSNNVYLRKFDFRPSSSVSSLEPSASEASCNSLDSDKSFSSEVSDRIWCTSIEADEVSDWSSARTSQVMDCDFDLADSASSTSVGTMRRKDKLTTLTFTNFRGLSLWELEYIRSIISNADLMFEEFALGQVHRIMDPDLFNQLESHIMESNKNLEEPFKVARRALFDCVEECLQLRCNRHFCGSFRAWDKWTALFQRTDHLAEDLYREIFGWANMVDLMVDELVDKDMSSQSGKWVEFETETFEEGIEIEEEILTSLLNELVDDILQF